MKALVFLLFSGETMPSTSSLCRRPLIAVAVLCGTLSASLVRADDAKATKPDVNRIAIFPGQMVRINVASHAFIRHVDNSTEIVARVCPVISGPGILLTGVDPGITRLKLTGKDDTYEECDVIVLPVVSLPSMPRR